MKHQSPSTKSQINSIQKYLKFPLTFPLSPTGEREGVRGSFEIEI
jgi:hypothetical protein